MPWAFSLQRDFIKPKHQWSHPATTFMNVRGHKIRVKCRGMVLFFLTRTVTNVTTKGRKLWGFIRAVRVDMGKHPCRVFTVLFIGQRISWVLLTRPVGSVEGGIGALWWIWPPRFSPRFQIYCISLRGGRVCKTVKGLKVKKEKPFVCCYFTAHNDLSVWQARW